MESEIATAPRNVARIQARRAADLSFKALRKIARRLGCDPTDEPLETVLLYPTVEDPETLADLTNRLAWYFPEDVTNLGQVAIPVHEGVAAGTVPECQRPYRKDHLPIERIDTTRVRETADAIDALLVWDVSTIFHRPVLTNLEKTEIVDDEFYSQVECNAWVSASGRATDVSDSRSRETFADLERRARDAERAFVFATGPSLSEATDFEFPDSSLKIICNSIVRDDELKEHVDPDVLVFADPVFHFGPSRYAEEFRRDAVETLRQYDCTAVVPDRYYGLLVGQFPSICGDAVGVATRQSDTPIYPSADRPEVMSTNNIMTLLMLPIASSLADEVYIVGADGREESESYFWEHDDDAQYDDELMNAAADCHPSFFRDRIYTDYYREHVQTLGDMIEYGERHGIDYYNLTHSYIDCLRARSTSPDWA